MLNIFQLLSSRTDHGYKKQQLKSFEKFFDDYMKEWNIEEEDIEEYRKMITDKIPVRDWGIVEDNGETYYIMYVL